MSYLLFNPPRTVEAMCSSCHRTVFYALADWEEIEVLQPIFCKDCYVDALKKGGLTS